MSCWDNVMSCDVMWCCDIVVEKLDVFMWCPYNVMSLPEVATMWCHVVTMWCHVMSKQCNVMSCCNNVMSCDVVMWCRYNVMSCREVTTMWCCNIVVDKLEVALWTCSFSGDLWCWPWFRPEFSEKKLKNGGGGENQKMLTIIILF